MWTGGTILIAFCALLMAALFFLDEKERPPIRKRKIEEWSDW